MALHTSPVIARSHGDPRRAEQIEMAERELRLPDPISNEPPALADLLHPNQGAWPDQTRHALHSALAPWRDSTPIEVPNLLVLKRLVAACKDSLDGRSWDASPEWSQIFGSDGKADAMQNRLRALFQGIRALNYPRIDDQLHAAIAEHLMAVFTAAAAEQKVRLERLERERGPVARAQSAAAVLEHAGPLLTALVEFDKATRDAGGSKWHGLAVDLQRLERVAKQELSA